jgi:hypothetical protein
LKAMNRASMTCIKKYNPHVIGIPEREENKWDRKNSWRNSFFKFSQTKQLTDPGISVSPIKKTIPKYT